MSGQDHIGCDCGHLPHAGRCFCGCAMHPVAGGEIPLHLNRVLMDTLAEYAQTFATRETETELDVLDAIESAALSAGYVKAEDLASLLAAARAEGAEKARAEVSPVIKELSAALRESQGIPASVHQRERLERMASEIEALRGQATRVRESIAADIEAHVAFGMGLGGDFVQGVQSGLRQATAIARGGEHV